MGAITSWRIRAREDGALADLRLSDSIPIVDPIEHALEDARQHRERQAFAQAIASLRSAALMAARSDEPQPLRAARIRLSLAIQYVETRSLRKAQCFARSALQGFEHHGGTDTDFAGAYNTIANISWFQGDAAGALTGYERTLDHYQRGNALPEDLARTYVNIALSFSRLGRDDDIAPTLNTALSLPLSPEQRAPVEYRLAVHYDRTAKFDMAIATFERLLSYAEPEDVPQVMASLAIIKDRRGEAAACLALLRRATIAAARLPTLRHHFINIVCSYAEQAAALGHPDDARKALRRAYGWTSQPRTSRDDETLLGARTAVALYQGAPKSIPRMLRKLERSRQNSFGDAHPFVLETRRYLADELGSRDPARAFAALSEAIDRCNAPPSNVEVIVAKVSLSGLALRQDQFQVAGALAREAVIREAGFELPDLRWRALAVIACVAHRTGSLDAAILLMKVAAETAQRLLLRTPDRATFHAITAMRQRLVYANLIGWLVSAGRFPEAERLHLAERTVTSLILTRRQTDSDAASVPTPMTVDERRSADEMEEIGTAWRAAISEQERAGVAVAAGDLDHPRAADMAAWLARAEDFRLPQGATKRREPIALPCGARDAILHYIVANGKVIVVARCHGAELRTELLEPEAAINAACFEFRQAILARSADADTLGRRLFNTLIGPIRNVIAEATTLHIVPDGGLRHLPFCALRSEAGFLIEAVPIQYVPAIRRDPALAPAPRGWRVAGLGNSELTHAEAELRAIPPANAALIRMGHRFDRDALAAALAERAEIIHVVSHFHLDPAHVERSSLAMGDGSVMRLEEFRDRRFDFSHVELLILSACDTGTVGQGQADNESLAGLFQVQGARRVLATLWPVADDGAAKLASRFYQAAFTHTGRQSLAEALQAAQLLMIKSGAEVPPARRDQRGGFGLAPAASMSHPYYWASHLLYSD